MAFDAYIKFVTPPVNGAAELGKGYTPDGDADKMNWVDMTEYSFSATMAVTQSRSSGTGAATTGKGKLEPFTFKKNVDRSSMALAFHAAAGTVFQKIVVNLFAVISDGSNQSPHQFLTIVLQGAVITSCKFSGSGGDDLPDEEISINYGSIEYKYKNFEVDTETGNITPGSKMATFNWSTIKNSGTKA